MSVNSKRLRITLRINAAFSAINGGVLVFFGQLGEIMQANPVTLKFVGVGLLLFAVSVVMVTKPRELKSKQVMSIVVQDVLWVLASAVVILTEIWNLSALAYWLIAFTAIVVASFGILQWRFLRRIH
ncbi:hypothetical protein [Roseivirga sp. E12]|uniref:hypothetical protein n=1 Tax=Roseivirga sp. E12 TaxID=2819237 RepID=UPI001ABC06F8|nr:hypothetical protein [Roseivirga sp. E12]MBO3698648.1 hypothetical protein [Roseivirga sp. E12]